MFPKTFTHGAVSGAEAVVSDMLSAVVTKIEKLVPASQFRALVLLGGYGKGEDGILAQEGCYRPHNNFDLMLIVSDLRRRTRRRLLESVKHSMLRLSEELGVGIDVSVLTERTVRQLPTRIFTYDMCEGHITLSGDASIIPSIDRNVFDIPDWDVRNLMVNRGALLLINALCLEKLKTIRVDHAELRKLIVKHTMKAIIGYGDSLLYYSGRYHWSYQEKRNRIAELGPQWRDFVALYQEAISFRFIPCYDIYLDIDIHRWQRKTLQILERVHLACERNRLGISKLSWGEYLRLALKALPTETGFSLKRIARLLLNLVKPSRGLLPDNCGWQSKLGYQTANKQTLMPIMFPLIAYELLLNKNDSAGVCFATSHFSTNRSEYIPENIDLVKRYLAAWGRHYDVNMAAVLDRYGISLRDGRAA